MEQLACIMEVNGTPPSDFVAISNRKKMFFDSQGQPRIVPNSRGKKRRPSTKELGTMINCNDKGFVDFLKGCLRWDPRTRFKPEDAIQHEWVLEGLQGQHAPSGAKTSRDGSRSSNNSGGTSKHRSNNNNNNNTDSEGKSLPSIGNKTHRAAKQEHVSYF